MLTSTRSVAEPRGARGLPKGPDNLHNVAHVLLVQPVLGSFSYRLFVVIIIIVVVIIIVTKIKRELLCSVSEIIIVCGYYAFFQLTCGGQKFCV
jgi:hypothetical protein